MADALNAEEQRNAVGQLPRDGRYAELPFGILMAVAFEVRLQERLLDRWIRGKDLCRHTFGGGSFATQGYEQKSQRRFADGDRSSRVSTDFLRAYSEQSRQRLHDFIPRQLFAVPEGEGQSEAVGTCLRSRCRPLSTIEPEEAGERLVQLDIARDAGTMLLGEAHRVVFDDHPLSFLVDPAASTNCASHVPDVRGVLAQPRSNGARRFATVRCVATCCRVGARECTWDREGDCNVPQELCGI